MDEDFVNAIAISIIGVILTVLMSLIYYHNKLELQLTHEIEMAKIEMQKNESCIKALDEIRATVDHVKQELSKETP